MRFAVALSLVAALLACFMLGANAAVTVSSKVITNAASTTLTITTNLNTNGAPVAGDFTVKIAGGAVTVNSVAHTDGTNTLALTIASAPTYGQSVTVSYVKSGTAGEQLTDVGSTDTLEDFTDSAVTNQVAMVVTSAQVTANRADRIEVVFSSTIHSTLPSATDFAVSSGGSGVTVSSLSMTGSTLYVQLAAAIVKTATTTISFTQPGDKLGDATNNYKVSSFSNQAVTNNVDWTVTSMTPGNVARNTETTITVDGTGFLTGSSKVMLSSSSTSCSVAGGGSAQLVTSGTQAARKFTLTGAAGTQNYLCFSKDGTNFVNVASTSVTLDVQLVSATVSTNRANVIVLSFTSAIGQTAAASGFTLAGVTGLTVSSTAVSSNAVELTLNKAVLKDETFTVKYDVPGGDPKIKEQTSNWELASFGATSVTNGVTWTFDTPSVTQIGKAVSTSLSYSGTGWSASNSKIMIASSACNAATGGNGQTIGTSTTEATMTFSIDENAGAMSICFSYDGDSARYVPIASSTINVQVPSVSNYGGRTRFAKKEVSTLAITGVGLNTNMGIKVIAGTCASPTTTYATVSFSSVNNAATSAQVQNLQITSAVDDAKICLNIHTSNGGSNDYGVDGDTVDVVSINSIDHTKLGRNVNTKVTLSGSQVTNDDSLKFVQHTSDCAQADITGTNDQQIQSTSFVNMQLTQSFTNSVLCLKVGGTGNSGSSWTTTDLQATIEMPSITSMDVDRYAKTESRSITFVGIGLSTDMKISIRQYSGCSGDTYLAETALASPSDDRKGASATIQLNTAANDGYVCVKVPTNQGGSDNFAYNTFTKSRMTVVGITATSPSQAGRNVQFEFTSTHTSGTWSGDSIKIVKAGEACSTGTIVGGGGEYQPSTATTNYGKEDLTLTEDAANAKICLKVSHIGSSYVDTTRTITVAKPVFTHISTDAYGGTQRRAYVDNSVLIYLQGYGLSDATKLSIAANADCTGVLAGAAAATITGTLADTTRAQITFTVTAANPTAYLCETIPTNNGGPGNTAKVSGDLQIDIAGNFRTLSITTGSGFKVGTAATTAFQVSLKKRASTSPSSNSFYYSSSTETDDDKHGVTSISAALTQCTTRACFNHNSQDNVQIKCTGSENTDYWRRTATLSGKTTMAVDASTAADFIKDGVATFTTAKIDYWGSGCRLVFTVTTQGGYQESYTMTKTATSSSFDVAGSAVKIAWKNSNLFLGGLATSTNVPVCTAGYECEIAPIIEIRDGSDNVITDNKLHGVTNVQITIPDNTADTLCPSGEYTNYNYGIVYNNRRYTITDGVITYPKSNGDNTASYATTQHCYQRHKYNQQTCTSDSTHNLMFNYFGHDVKVRVTAETPANNVHHTLSATLGDGYRLDHTLTVKGKATHLELTMDMDNWVKGYGPTKSTATGSTTNSNVSPQRGAPFVTVYEQGIPNANSKNRLTDHECITGVVDVTASISTQHDESGTRGNAALVGGSFETTHSSGNFIFKKITMNDYGRGFQLNFTSNVPTHKDMVTGHTFQSSAFNVGVLMYKRTLTVKEIDKTTGNYKSADEV
jgi:hypothetical protein